MWQTSPLNLDSMKNLVTYQFLLLAVCCLSHPDLTWCLHSHITSYACTPYVYLGISSFVHFHVYSDLIPTSSHDRWLMPTHLKTPTKSSLDLRLMPNRLIHSHVYSSHLDLTAHDLQLMPDRLKTLSHLSLVSFLTHDDSSQDAFLFIFHLISIILRLISIHLSTHQDPYLFLEWHSHAFYLDSWLIPSLCYL